MDRLIKEHLRIKYYTRYMDDAVLLHEDKDYLKYCLKEMRSHVENELHLSFNHKTQIFPIRNGVDYLGFHFYLTGSGRVVRKVRQSAKRRMKRKLKYLQHEYGQGNVELADITMILNSHMAHMEHGDTWHLRRKLLRDFILTREN